MPIDLAFFPVESTLAFGLAWPGLAWPGLAKGWQAKAHLPMKCSKMGRMFRSSTASLSGHPPSIPGASNARRSKRQDLVRPA